MAYIRIGFSPEWYEAHGITPPEARLPDYYEATGTWPTLLYFVSLDVPLSYQQTPNANKNLDWVRVWDGGIELTREANYSSEADLLANAPSEGCVRWYFGDSTYFRLGSEPAFDLRVLCNNVLHVGGTQYFCDSRAFFAELGLDIQSVGVVYVEHLYVDDPSFTYMDALNAGALAYGQSFGFNRLGQFDAYLFREPTGTPLWTFTTNNVIDISRQLPSQMPYPIWKYTMNSGQTWPVSQLADGTPSSVTLVSTEYELRQELLKAPWRRTFTYEDDTVKDKHLLASEFEISTPHTSAWNDAQWAQEYTRKMALFGVEREELTVVCQLDGDTLDLDINDVVSVQMDRLGLDAGKLFRIVVVRYELSRKRVEFVLWG